MSVVGMIIDICTRFAQQTLDRITRTEFDHPTPDGFALTDGVLAFRARCSWPRWHDSCSDVRLLVRVSEQRDHVIILPGSPKTVTA
jgi:hypothetical protein